jgi:two-component system response regulator VicR
MAHLILCVEDELPVTELLSDILCHPDIEMRKAYTVQEATAQIAEQLPDLILLDIMMPDISGWTLYDTIRADPDSCQVPVIVITALAHLYERRHALSDSPIDAYITKPFSASEVRTEVERLLGAKIWSSGPDRATPPTSAPRPE